MPTVRAPQPSLERHAETRPARARNTLEASPSPTAVSPTAISRTAISRAATIAGGPAANLDSSHCGSGAGEHGHVFDDASADAAVKEGIAAFQRQLGASRRVLAIVGAGLSAASGLPPFRGAGATTLSSWRGYDVADLATPEAFDVDAKLVWQFYAWRRREALAVEPNAGHVALARLATLWPAPRLLTLTQNVDGLSERAGHPQHGLVHLNGDLFAVQCARAGCPYRVRNTDPDLGERSVPLCPQCGAKLRPGVVWFGEPVPYAALIAATEAIESGEVDVILCIGMSAEVWPAAGYVEEVVRRGGAVAVFNPDRDTRRPSGWFFGGGAETWLPRSLGELVGPTRGRDVDSSDMSDVSDLSDED